MKVLNAKVDWHERWDNSPVLMLLVDKMPDHDDLRYEKKGSLYYAELDGYVSFFAYSGPDRGFGGSVFNITMKDGSKAALKGPWSSRAGAMNGAGFGPCVDICITDEPDSFERGWTVYAGHATLEICIKAVQEFLPEVILMWIEGSDEMVFTPVLTDGRKKPNPQTHHGKLDNMWKVKKSSEKKRTGFPEASGEQFNVITK